MTRPLPKVTLLRITEQLIDDEIRQMPAQIWSGISAQAALRTLTECSHDYYLIISEGKRAGLIGHSRDMRSDFSVGLLHSGLLGDYRKKVIFRSALAELERLVLKKFPTAQIIREEGPMRIREYFESIGFKVVAPGGEGSPTILVKRI